MAIYTKKASEEWKKSFLEFEQLTGFEIMYQEDIDSGEMSCLEVWNANADWLHSLYSDATNIKIPND